MRILALNCGSSTVKFQLFDTEGEGARPGSERVLARGTVDRIGAPAADITFQRDGKGRSSFPAALADHQAALHTVFACLTDPAEGVLSTLGEIGGVGHRMVYVGEGFTGPVRLNEDAKRKIEAAAHLAPLHTPHNMRGVRAVEAELPGCPNVAVFDTSFHQTIPKRAFLYALPYEFYAEHRLRRYGFHGISHEYVTRRFAEIRGTGPEALKLITCHLGSGASMCAVDRGRSVDCSLGFSPLAGLVMGTRPGDLDSGLLLHLMRTRKWTPEDAYGLLNNKSGLLGISGVSNDMRELIGAAAAGHERARTAIEVFCYQVKRYIGMFYGVLNGADALIFTGGIGENAPLVRAMACESLDALGISIDPERNERAAGVEARISTARAGVEVWVVPTNEELLIARETVRCIRNTDGGG